MPLHPKIRALLDLRAALPAVEDLGAVAARRRVEDFARQMRIDLPLPAAVRDMTIEAEGRDIPARLYTPPGTGPFALIVFVHGGGFVLSSLDTHDWLCRAICVRANAVVLSVGYRLAPEHKYPAGLDDCVAATLFAFREARAWGGRPDNLFVMGDSAGGTLAAATCLHLRDEGGPMPAGQVLFYPATDLGMQTPSHVEFRDGFGLTARTMAWFIAQYCPAGADKTDPRLSPLLAKDLDGLPPALIITAECDVLRDEGECFAARLAKAGISTRVHRYAGMNHGFLFHAALLPDSFRAIDEACGWIAAAQPGRHP